MHSGQETISDSDSAPEPLHLLHCSNLGTTICFVTPEAAESWADNEGLKDGEYTIDSVVLPASSEKMFDRYPQLPDWF